MITTETVVPRTKLKIKFSTARIEVDPLVKCQFGQEVAQIDANRPCNSKEESSVPDSNKRGLPWSFEGQKEKRKKIDRKASLQCATILKSLISHPYGWVFSKPVDPVALNIPDYFTIISRPMDLGTIKSKLEKNTYSGMEEFAADVRLTFSNSMTYNSPSNDVHLMARELNKIFDRKWEDLEKKWKFENEHGKRMTGTIKVTVKKSCNGMNSLQKDTWPNRPLVSEQKGNQKIGSLAAKDAKVAVPKSSQIPCKFSGKNLNKGSKRNHDGGHPSSSVKACPSLGLVTHKCSVCGESTCHCLITSDSTHPSSDGRHLIACDADALRQDCPVKHASPLQRKSNPDSDEAVRALDSEHERSSSKLATPAADASSGEVWSPPDFYAQLSPKKALRAAMLKCRFADTILKAQQKTLVEHGDKGDPVKLQLEKERLERMQREERTRIEAQIKTAEAAARMKAEEELRQQREKEREAARVAIQKMERTVEIEHNLEVLEELEMLSGCTLSYRALSGKDGYRVAMELEKPQIENPLERLGLFIKDEYSADEDEEFLYGGWEEGEIFVNIR